MQLLWEQTNTDFTVGQCLASDETRAFQIPVMHDMLSNGNIKGNIVYQCLLTDQGFYVS